jgi:predicted Zn-dependent protease
MSHRFSDLYKQLRRRWFYGFLSTLVALGLVIGTPQPAPAIPWGELILRGIQVVQLSSISDRQEVSLGGKINEQLIGQNNVKLYANSSVKQYVNSVGQRLVPESERLYLPSSRRQRSQCLCNDGRLCLRHHWVAQSCRQ